MLAVRFSRLVKLEHRAELLSAANVSVINTATDSIIGSPMMYVIRDLSKSTL